MTTKISLCFLFNEYKTCSGSISGNDFENETEAMQPMDKDENYEINKAVAQANLNIGARPIDQNVIDALIEASKSRSFRCFVKFLNDQGESPSYHLWLQNFLLHADLADYNKQKSNKNGPSKMSTSHDYLDAATTYENATKLLETDSIYTTAANNTGKTPKICTSNSFAQVSC